MDMSNGMTSSMARSLAAISSVVAAIVAMFMPVVTGPAISTALINPFWGSIYGLGFLAAKFLVDMRPGAVGFAVAVFGIIIWPAIVTAAVYFFFRRLLMGSSGWQVAVGIAIFLVTIVYNVRIGSVPGTFVEQLPLFTAFLDI